ncbi:hypothetical protein M422DRAFT_29507 [Sphaerobolus stellatus SS14]|uniref:Unplaced genomic scaffold SPHSTscaffold_35, whole genome shotgun sequence n=1 Tax=Sphaerobolus stellatus (strain SS14) TaxID=990650 RepID=A0A0C9W3K5_SPHS4|nr:hypothetical protein M422DRAFT_29507 [Sphaerobolus stellatus SS14]
MRLAPTKKISNIRNSTVCAFPAPFLTGAFCTVTIIKAFFTAKFIAEKRRPSHAAFMARANTIFDITPLASSLKDFGGPNINTFDTADSIDLDLGTFEIREVTLGNIRNFVELVPGKPLWRMRL